MRVGPQILSDPACWHGISMLSQVSTHELVCLSTVCEHIHSRACTEQSICLREPAVRNESTVSWNQITTF